MKPFVLGNWKMNLDHVQAIHLTQQLGVLVRTMEPGVINVAVAAPFTDLRSVSSVIDADRLALHVVAQHVHFEESGAFTGEVSVAMLKRLGVSAVIVGHSERRSMFGMSDDVVRATAAAAWRGDLKVVLCVGEDEATRESGDHVEFVVSQLADALLEANVTPGALAVAYEPIWAIGSGATASTAQVREVVEGLRAALPEALRDNTPVLYGGSVKPDNAEELVREGRADGFLVGGASLKAETFFAIVSAVADCYPRNRQSGGFSC